MKNKRILWIVLGITGALAILCCVSIVLIPMAFGIEGVNFNNGDVTIVMNQQATVGVVLPGPTSTLAATLALPTSTEAAEEPTEAPEPTSEAVEVEPTATEEPKVARPANNGQSGPDNSSGASGGVGERMEGGSAAITVVKVTNVPDLSGWTPAEGSIYLDFEVTLENVGSETLYYSPVNFKAKDSSGKLYDHGWETPQPAITSGQLAPGDKVTGHVIYEVVGGPGDTYTLVYTPQEPTGDPLEVMVEAPAAE